MEQLNTTLTEILQNKNDCCATTWTLAGVAGAAVLLAGKSYFNGGVNRATMDLTGKVVIITGSNAGIGAETAKVLATKGATIVLACRDEAKTKIVINEIIKTTGNKNVEYIRLDLSDLESVREFTKQFRAKY
eukprot:CAMPEP_0176445834 /NCGR_PEP_ID=MMETSP0127-20121128/23953_1 /TAXON_ID=938130 /ORGANISM="Platyophrya macrostoma, Strain WH" /LENGTH=131 /DNA_ID=CAMNT_0017831727 /DNA_START=15 /DNA_END=407 /DNA_ORIENTATION=-